MKKVILLSFLICGCAVKVVEIGNDKYERLTKLVKSNADIRPMVEIALKDGYVSDDEYYEIQKEVCRIALKKELEKHK